MKRRIFRNLCWVASAVFLAGTAIIAGVLYRHVPDLLPRLIAPILITLIIAIALSYWVASRLSRQIIEPLNALNLDEPLLSDTYEELAPLLTKLSHRHRRIEAEVTALRRKQDEFDAVTDSMNEGLVLLGENGRLLSLNTSAARLLGADARSVGRDLLAVSRNLEIDALVKRAQRGERAEKDIALAGSMVRLHASPVYTGGVIAGVALLLFDISDHLSAEQMRREFTANVSHELKTPIHAISGCAELLKNGMVKPEDTQKFAEQIYLEARRMTRLVEDIIHLSRLDEGAEDMRREDVSLMDVAREAVESLAPAARERGIALTLRGEAGRMRGIPRLLHGIVFNLCDNAIKYGREGGRAEVVIEEDENDVALTVADTGIGIPPEHQARVFERFYRVDKSHSKAIGGTGLGLSIVKHAARLHGARVDLQSVPGEGTTVVLRFPKQWAE